MHLQLCDHHLRNEQRVNGSTSKAGDMTANLRLMSVKHAKTFV